jgi:hypothetical protein
VQLDEVFARPVCVVPVKKAEAMSFYLQAHPGGWWQTLLQEMQLLPHGHPFVQCLQQDVEPVRFVADCPAGWV